MSRLRLSLLGPLQFRLEGKLIRGFKSDKVRALLVYLAVEAQRPHRREALAGLLWPELPDRDAMSNLRYALYNLRKSLKDSQTELPFLLVTREDLQFNQASNHFLDVATFSQLASERVATASRSQPIWEAVELYRGAFLEGFSLEKCAAFEEWTLLKREMYGRQLYTFLQWLAEHHGQRGEYELAEQAIRSQLQIEPWDENAHRQLMDLLARHGQRAAALAQYEACRYLLAEELDVEPAPETKQLYERIRLGQLRSSDVAEQRRKFSQPLEQTPFQPTPAVDLTIVSRESEMDQLQNHLLSTLTGQGKVIFIKGDSGSGKTVLLESFGRLAAKNHPTLLVATANCRAYGGTGDPFLPFRQLLAAFARQSKSRALSASPIKEEVYPIQPVQNLNRQTPNRLTSDLLDQLQIRAIQPVIDDNLKLGQDLEEQPWSFSRDGQAPTHPPGQRQESLAQSVLFEQITQFLQTVAGYSPLLLLIDDLQWIDSGSASLLFHLGRQLKDSRILIAGAYRPGDVTVNAFVTSNGPGQRHPMAAIINEFQREFGRIMVDLDRTNGRGFVDAFLDTEPNQLDPSFRETFFRHTGGHALFTVELMRGLEQRGDLVQDKEGRWMVGPSLNWERLPARVEAVIAERIERLPAEALEILSAACVQGQEFVAEVVARVQQVDEHYVIHLLSNSLSKDHRMVRARGVQHEGDHRFSNYAFRHFLFQQYIYQHLDQVERVLLHEATGQALEELYAEQAGEHASRLAHHFEAAGVVEKAVDYLSQAGKIAYLLSANEEAVAYFKRGLALIAARPSRPNQVDLELTLQIALSAPLRAARGFAAPEIGTVYARIGELAQQTGDPIRSSQANFLLWTYYLSRADYQKAMDLALRLKNQAGQEGQTFMLPQAHLALGTTQIYLGEFRESRRNLEMSLSGNESGVHDYLISPIGHDIQIAAQICLVRTMWFLGYPAQALKKYDRTLKQIKELNHAPSQALAMAMAGCITFFLGRDYRQSEAQAEALLQLSVEQGLAFYESWAKIFQGRGQVERGRFMSGLANIREGITGCLAAGQHSSSTLIHALMAEACLSAKHPEQALSWLEKAQCLVQKTGEQFYEAEIHRLKGDLLLQKGANEGVVELAYRRAILVARRQEAKSFELRAVNSLAQLWQFQGRLEQASVILPEIYDWFTEGYDTADLSESEMLLTQLREQALPTKLSIDR